MKEIEIVDLIKKYLELEEIVESSKLSLEELCDELNGHNLDEDLFDLYFGKDKDYLGTVYKNENGFYLGSNVNCWINEEWIDVDMGLWTEEDTLINYVGRNNYENSNK